MKLFLLLFLFFTSLTLSAQYQGQVISITDGDTFTILREGNKTEKIRLYGIDCPEKGQPFGRQAKFGLSQLIFNKTVSIEFKNLDRYKRSIAIVYCNGVNINEQMLIRGWAWHFKRYDNNPDWAKLEEKARISKQGLWVEQQPIAPWAWRRSE